MATPYISGGKSEILRLPPEKIHPRKPAGINEKRGHAPFLVS